jgi:hypothetical protein
MLSGEETPMRNGGLDMSKWHSAASICAWLSLLCWLPYLTFALFAVARGRVEFPNWVFMMLIWTPLASPVAGILLALVAATARRWWLVLAAVWLAALSFGLWDMFRHPFNL